MNALIVCAGLGTRLRPLTDHCPKALVPVDGRPMLDHQIERLRDAGFDHIAINVHHFAEQLIDHVAAHDYGIRIDISDERSQLLDTGGAVRQALRLFPDDEPLLVHNVDVFTDADLRRLWDTHLESGADASLLVSPRTTSRYLVFNDAMRLCGWTNISTGAVRTPFAEVEAALTSHNDPVETDIMIHEAGIKLPALHLMAFAGIHIVSPTLRERLLQQQNPVFSIVDFWLDACADADIRGICAHEGFRFVDAGKPEALPKAALLLHSL